MLWTFRKELVAQTFFRLLQMSLEFTGMYFTQEFYAYLEKTDEQVMEGVIMTDSSTMYETMLYYLAQNRGYVILLGIMVFEWPKQLLDDIFHKLLDGFLEKKLRRFLLKEKRLLIKN